MEEGIYILELLCACVHVRERGARVFFLLNMFVCLSLYVDSEDFKGASYIPLLCSFYASKLLPERRGLAILAVPFAPLAK